MRKPVSTANEGLPSHGTTPPQTPPRLLSALLLFSSSLRSPLSWLVAAGRVTWSRYLTPIRASLTILISLASASRSNSTEGALSRKPTKTQSISPAEELRHHPTPSRGTERGNLDRGSLAVWPVHFPRRIQRSFSHESDSFPGPTPLVQPPLCTTTYRSRRPALQDPASSSLGPVSSTRVGPFTSACISPRLS
jgi:hypothetical protein